MGMNRWSGGTDDRKRKEKDARAGNEGDATSRLEFSEEPAGDPEKRRVLEKDERGH